MKGAGGGSGGQVPRWQTYGSTDTSLVRTPSAAPPLELGVGRSGLQITVEANLVSKC
jgi:hypothetical protein